MKFLNKNKYNLLLKITKNSFVLVFTFLLIINIALAQSTNNTTNTGNIGGTTTTGTSFTTKIDNPLSSDLDTIPKFIEAIIEIVLVVGIPIVALAIIYTGFLFVSAQGNKEKLITAKKALVYTLVGAVLILGAFVISKAIVSTVEEIKS